MATNANNSTRVEQMQFQFIHRRNLGEFNHPKFLVSIAETSQLIEEYLR